MKILFIGVFTEGSTNNSQRDCIRSLGHTVDEFPYRSISNFNIELQKIKDQIDDATAKLAQKEMVYLNIQ